MAAPEASQPFAENLKTQYGSAGDAKEVDDPDGTASPEGEGKFFPVRPFKSLPVLEQFMPDNLAEIHNCVHLLLVLGSIGALVISVDYSHFISRRCVGEYCHVRYLALVYLILCTVEFLVLMRQYNGRVVRKQQQVKKEQKKIHQSYEDSIEELEAHMKEAMATNIQLSERNFDGYRKDLLRVMQRYPNRLPENNTPDGLLDEFRKLLIQWLDVFAECSTNPLQKPRNLVDRDELNAQDTVKGACALMEEPLKALQVKFLDEAKENGTSHMKTLQSKMSKMAGMQHAAQTQWAKLCGVEEITGPDSEDVTIRMEAGKAGEQKHKKIKYRWVQWGTRDDYLAFEEPEVSQTFPREFNAGFVRIIILSVEHLRILLMFMLGFLALYVEDGCQFFTWLGLHSVSPALRELAEETVKPTSARGYTRWYFWYILFCQVAMFIVLWDYLNIDVCLKLDKEIAQFKRQLEDVEAKRAAIKEFYENLSDLAEFWLHHSLIRLELLKFFFAELSTARPGEGHEMLVKANPCIAELEDSLPSLEMWLTKDETKQIKPEDKAPFVEGLAKLPDICHSQGLDPGLEAIRKTSSDLKARTNRLIASSEGS